MFALLTTPITQTLPSARAKLYTGWLQASFEEKTLTKVSYLREVMNTPDFVYGESLTIFSGSKERAKNLVHGHSHKVSEFHNILGGE